ncbi:hypothetical protein BX600DRAFT_81349 [Xylariales sp. PMI_506]|nr:hypothetical protein BX600DRAFT_81349 [Xylariales sp. PMI_506]
MAEEQPSSSRSPGSDVSPGSQPTRKHDYFTNTSLTKGKSSQGGAPSSAITEGGAAPAIAATVDGVDRIADKDSDCDSNATATTPGDVAPSPDSNSDAPSRKTSISSVSFRPPRNQNLPQGIKKPHSQRRVRDSSPPHSRFESHVAFDNIPLGESTEYNPISFTLNVKHAGYQLQRRSRTFMVGVDDNAYSDHALQWLLDELVDDGDEVVCVRVIETPVRLTDKAYQDAARELMDRIQAKNLKNHAVSLVLEYAVGKLHNTFQHLIKMYQPSMLVVGTKGRSLDGVHGFLVNRNSFSKYCLQYSPVPVVVVRPTEKREKKKAKRAQDPTRHSYIHMLSGQKHEADSENSSVYELEPTLTADEEAHRVAVAVGLPAAYDPTIKPVDLNAILNRSARRSSRGDSVTKEAVALAASGRVPADLDSKEADGDGSESEYEEEFEVTPGELALKKERLHKMESNEGAALREMRKMSRESIEEESGDEDGGAKTGAQ